MTDLYNWQYKDYAALSQMQNKPSQSLLISAMPGIGQDILVRNYIALLMCDQPCLVDNVSYACNACQSCTLFMNDNHPDIYSLVIDIDADKKSISVEDIRGMLEFLSMTTHIGRYKIVLIPDVDLLSINSANALLKILEEPPAYALFILQTSNISGVLATILSRCHVYKLSRLNVSDALTYVQASGLFNPKFWLNYYDNAPLFELEISEVQFDALIKALLQPSVENIFLASSQFDAKNAGFLIGFLTRWLTDVAGILQGAPLRYFMAYETQLNGLVKRIDLAKVFYLFDQVNFLQDWTLHPLNYRLQLENLLLQYQGIFTVR